MIGLLVLTVIAYARVMTFGLVYDDAYWLWPAPKGAGLGPMTPFVLTAWIGGGLPWAYHALILGLHLVNGWLVYTLARRWLSDYAAVIVLMLFWLHPIQVEAVAYVSGGIEVLLTTYVLIAVLGLVSRSLVLNGIGAGCLWLAVTLKPSALPLLVAVPLVVWVMKRYANVRLVGHVEMAPEVFRDDVREVEIVSPVVVPILLTDCAKRGDGVRPLQSPRFRGAVRLPEFANGLSEDASPCRVGTFSEDAIVVVCINHSLTILALLTVAAAAVFAWRQTVAAMISSVSLSSRFDALTVLALSVWRYLALLVWPVGFSIEHPASGSVLALLALIVGAAVAYRSRWAAPQWACAWLAVLLLPRALVPHDVPPLTEHHLYLPFLSVWVTAGSALDRFAFQGA